MWVGRENKIEMYSQKIVCDTLKRLRPIGKGDQELEKRLIQEELI
jgi:hypothetical protein